MQTKIFSESNESLLENEINAWIRRNDVFVKNIRFSSSVSTIPVEDDYGRSSQTSYLYSAMIIYKGGEKVE